MKIGIAVAGPAALPSAFVVFRDDFCRSVDRAASFGYDGQVPSREAGPSATVGLTGADAVDWSVDVARRPI